MALDRALVLRLLEQRLSGYLSRADRRYPLARLLLLLVLVLPVLLIAAVSYFRMERDLTASALSRRQTIAVLAAAIVKEKLDRIIDVGISLATRVRLLASLQRAGVKPGEKKEILIVDDNPKILKLAEIAIKPLQCETLCVGSAESGPASPVVGTEHCAQEPRRS